MWWYSELVFGRWLGYEGGGFVMGLDASPIGEAWKNFLSLCSERIQWADSHLWTRKKAFTKNPAILAPWSWASQLQNHEKQCLLLKPPSQWYICYSISNCKTPKRAPLKRLRTSKEGKCKEVNPWVICQVLTVSTVGSGRRASACSAGDPGLIPELGRSPGEGNGTPLQYFCLGNPMDKVA